MPENSDWASRGNLLKIGVDSVDDRVRFVVGQVLCDDGRANSARTGR